MLLASNRNYRLLLSASAMSNLGDGVALLALPWLATLLTRDPFLISLIAFATRAPWFLFSIPAGVWTDRADRRRLMAQADVLRVGLTALIVGLIMSAPQLPAHDASPLYILALAGLAFLLGSAEVVRDNAAQTALPSIVEKPQLEQANGQIWSVEHVFGSFIGPPLAGFLIAYATPAPFLLDIVAFGLSAWLIWMIAMPPRVARAVRSPWEEAKEGVRWIRGAPVILRLAVMLGFVNALFLMTLTILVLFSQEVLGLTAFEHGLLLAAEALGGVIGGLTGPWVVARLGGQRTLFLSLAIFPVTFVIVGLTSSPIIAGAALFVSMYGGLLWNIVTVSYRQRHIPDDLLGRVNSIYRFFGWGMMPLGALAGGAMVALFEADIGRETALRLPFLFAAAGSLVLLLYGLRRLKL